MNRHLILERKFFIIEIVVFISVLVSVQGHRHNREPGENPGWHRRCKHRCTHIRWRKPVTDDREGRITGNRDVSQNCC